jgi:hypothetical protein
VGEGEGEVLIDESQLGSYMTQSRAEDARASTAITPYHETWARLG